MEMVATPPSQTPSCPFTPEELLTRRVASRCSVTMVTITLATNSAHERWNDMLLGWRVQATACCWILNPSAMTMAGHFTALDPGEGFSSPQTSEQINSLGGS